MFILQTILNLYVHLNWITPFDEANKSSCLLSIVTMSLSCTVSEIQRDIGRKSPTVTYPYSIWRPVGGDPVEFRRDLWHKKLESLGHSMALFALSCI